MKIASVPEWTGPRQWNTYPSQKSAPIPLTAGRQYYLELLWKEDFGGDHGSVAVKRMAEADPANDQGELTGNRIGTYLEGVPPVDLRIARNGPGAVLTWSGGTNPRLFSASQVLGPWTEVVGSASPYPVLLSGTARFFVLRDGARVSPNCVGYVNLPVVAGDNLLQNPLNAGANLVADVLADVPDGTTVFRFLGDRYESDVKFLGRFVRGTGVCRPGTGFFLRSPAALTLSFVGEVPQGDLSMPVVRGMNLVGSWVPQAGKLVADLGYNPGEGDAVFRFNPATGGFSSAGFDFGSWSPGDPSIAIGEAFFIQTGASRTWSRAFSVRP